VVPWHLTNFLLLYFCFIFIQTFFDFCFSVSWVRTAMTNSGERKGLNSEV
jgi:hypothetical protein